MKLDLGHNLKLPEAVLAQHMAVLGKTRSGKSSVLAAAAGYTNLSSKGFSNAIGRLRSLGFIDYPERGQVVACPVLFLEGK